LYHALEVGCYTFKNLRKMKKIITILITACLYLNSYAQMEKRELEDFSVLKMRNAVELILVQGDKNEIEIVGAYVESFPNIKTEVTNGVLSIYTEGKVKWDKNINVYLTYKELKGIELSGASELSGLSTITAEQFYLKGSGATKTDLNMLVGELAINFSGASEIKLGGNADNFKVNLSGASNLKAADFVAKNVEIDVSGASDIKVNATESISGKATGASNVNVKGSPSVRAINRSGASNANFDNNLNYHSSSDGITVEVGKKKLVVVEDEDVDVQLGNKQVAVTEDTIKVRWGATNLYIADDSVWVKRKVTKVRRNHWAGLDLGINGFVNKDNSFDLRNDEFTDPEDVTQFMELNYGKSWTFSINFLEHFFKIKGNKFGFVTGLGTEWNNYELKNNVRLTAKGGSNVFDNVNGFNENYTWGEIDTVLNYSKNRFKTWFVNVPLLLELNTGHRANKSFHISAGAILGLNLQTKIKYKYKIDGDTKKEKDKQSFNTNAFRTSLTVRAGYDWFNVFATYSLTPLFEKGRGPELYPFTVGVTLLGF